MNNNYRLLSALLLASAWNASAYGAIVAVDCTKKGSSLQAAINKFDKSLANTVTVTGACTENVVASGHRDLTIAGDSGTSLTAAAGGNATLEILGSRVVVRNLTVSGASLVNTTVSCDDRSVCILENVSAIDSQGTGIGAQKQSSVDLTGSPTTVISGHPVAGIGVYGQSSINIRSAIANDQPGVTITGNGTGIQAIDGSFVRVENAQITGNTGDGVFGDRGAVFKVFGTNVSNNAGRGAYMRASTLQTSPQFSLAATYSNNTGPGLVLRNLSYGQVFGVTISDNGGTYPAGVDCATTGTLRTDNATRAASNPACLVE